MYRKLIICLMMIISAVFQSFTITTMPLTEERKISVEIKGEVENPGVYELDTGSTYEDILELACLKPDADTDSFYFDETLYHSQLIVVPSKKEKKLISINSADIEELILLPGIGEKIAERIIRYRKENGSFLKLEDIMNVKGIGYGIFEKIREYITL